MICIAIDGPAGSGKSTVSKLVAEKLNFISVDTGAFYRAIAYYFKVNNLSYDDDSKLEMVLENINLEVKNLDGKFSVFLNGENVTEKIRHEEISKISSDISKFPQVRKFLLDFQRKLGNSENCVMDGRDIGTVVMPNAKVKIFLTASLKVRAMRRYNQLGKSVSYEKILEYLKKRDYQDSHREISPLKKADDAILIDNSDITLEETVEKICNIVRNLK